MPFSRVYRAPFCSVRTCRTEDGYRTFSTTTEYVPFDNGSYDYVVTKDGRKIHTSPMRRPFCDKHAGEAAEAYMNRDKTNG